MAFSELHGALHRNFREHRLDRSEFDGVLDRFDTDVEEEMWHWLPITMSVHQRVASVYRELPSSVFLRSADAIHLATAAEHGFSRIYSSDRHLLTAAPHLGLTGVNLIDD